VPATATGLFKRDRASAKCFWAAVKGVWYWWYCDLDAEGGVEVGLVGRDREEVMQVWGIGYC
jgi:hypothetical protein